MSFLMHITFDNPYRLHRKVNYFEYNGVRFKLIQNDPRKWSDVLLTITDSFHSPDVQRAYTAAGEFASAFGWYQKGGVSIGLSGGPGLRPGFTLKRARCVNFTFPQLPYRGMMGGYSLHTIAKIETDDQRKALTLYREAKSSNKVFLSVLFYWQILEITHHQPDNWINKTVKRNPSLLAHMSEYLGRLPLNGRSLGVYLQSDCRHAIAHVTRHAGKAALKFDDQAENSRLWASARILEELAEHYIENDLGVTEDLYLVRRGKRGFPTFLDAQTIEKGWYAAVRK